MHRETGTRTFADEVVGDDLGRNERLERIHAALDWERIAAIVADLHSSREGRKAYPPLLMFKALLLQHLHDAKRSQARGEAEQRSFVAPLRGSGADRRDAGPRDDQPVPQPDGGEGAYAPGVRRGERPAGREGDVRARRHGGGRDAGQGAEARRPRYRKDEDGSRVPNPIDPDADWGRGGSYGYKWHLAIDHGSWLVRDALVTPANVGDIDMFEALIQGDEEVLYGDAAYESVKHRDLLEKMGKGNALMRRGNKHHPMPEDEKARNAETSRPRMPAEGVFGYMKRTLGYRKVRYMGLVKGEAELLLKSLIYNVVRSLNMRRAPARA